MYNKAAQSAKLFSIWRSAWASDTVKSITLERTLICCVEQIVLDLFTGIFPQKGLLFFFFQRSRYPVYKLRCATFRFWWNKAALQLLMKKYTLRQFCVCSGLLKKFSDFDHWNRYLKQPVCTITEGFCSIFGQNGVNILTKVAHTTTLEMHPEQQDYDLLDLREF